MTQEDKQQTNKGEEYEIQEVTPYCLVKILKSPLPVEGIAKTDKELDAYAKGYTDAQKVFASQRQLLMEKIQKEISHANSISINGVQNELVDMYKKGLMFTFSLLHSSLEDKE